MLRSRFLLRSSTTSMPSTRRLKTFTFLLVVAVCTIFYLTNDARRAVSQDFYTNTVNALNAKDRASQHDSSDLHDIREAAKKGAIPETDGLPRQAGAKQQAPLVVPVPTKGPDEKEGKGSKVVGGRQPIKGGEKWDMATGKEAPVKDGKGKKGKEEEKESEEEHEVEVELNGILKKGPIIIFSKSYCPFSAKAKNILLKKYIIVPEPYVVELDQHPLGSGLQAHLAKSTGRRTVPNVLINGKSIGGGDEVEALDTSGALIEKVKSMGGKRIMEAKLAS